MVVASTPTPTPSATGHELRATSNATSGNTSETRISCTSDQSKGS
jgi:hypothetical protein